MAIRSSRDLFQVGMPTVTLAARRSGVPPSRASGIVASTRVIGRSACVVWRMARRIGVLDRAKPGLTPVGVDRTWTEPVTHAVVTTAHDAFQDQTVALYLDHLAVALVDQTLYPILDPVAAAAVRDHLGVERQPARHPALVQRRCDLIG